MFFLKWCFLGDTGDPVGGRNPIPNHLRCFQHFVNNGVNYQPQLVNAGFLNHQQYVPKTSMDTQNEGLEEVTPVEIWQVLVSILDFWGVLC